MTFDAQAGGLERLQRWLPCLALAALLTSCGGGGGGSEERVTIRGKVEGGEATVCLDANGSGTCDAGEPQARSDATGAYQLSIPADSSAPLVAEMGPAGAFTYRMASPSVAYSTTLTPLTTVVHLCGPYDSALAEDMARNALGMPPRFALKPDAAAAPGALAQAVAASVVTALKATARSADWSRPDALGKVVGAFPAALTDLPQLRIATKNGAPVDSLEVYVDATFALTNPAVSSEASTLNGKMRGRGHSTWGWPKNPYKVQFSNDAAYAKIADVLGMRKNRNWALLADYFDRSLMRNKLALSLANSSVFSDGLKWNPSGQHLEVYLNGDYIGVYLLTEDIRIAPERLDIRVMSADPAANQVDGGYIVEIDARLDCYNDGVLNLQHHTPQGVPLCVSKPDEGSITLPQLAYVKGAIDAAEQDLYLRNEIGRIDAASFADWYLVQELFRNADAVFWSSDYMWKDTDAAANPRDRLLNMGPIWDFDRAAGNVNYNDGWLTEGCWVTKTLPHSPNWFSKIFDNPQFLDLTLARWKQKRPALEKYVNYSIDAYARRLDAAQQRNFARWPIFGTQLTNYYTFSTYAEEVAFVKKFLNDRMAWLDKAYASPESFNALCR
ncbi:MAG: CotH kinase family protein [Usitatibacter sp.]